MTAKSWAQRVVKIPNNTFADTEPISASQAFLARNNACHLIDESPQLYVNWGRVFLTSGAGAPTMSSLMVREPQFISSEAPTVANPNFLDITHRYQQSFALDWLDPERPANLMVLTDWAGIDATNNEDITCRVIVCPASSPAWSGQNAIFDVSETAAESTLGSTSAFIDTSEHLGILGGAWKQVGTVEENGRWFQPSLCMMRLEIMLSFGSTPWTLDIDDYPVDPDDSDVLALLGVACWGYG